MIDEKLAEQASLYVFELLDPAEERAFAAELERHPELREHVDDLTATAAKLAHVAAPRRLPPEIGPRLLERLRAEEKIVAFPVREHAPATGWMRGVIPWSLAAVLAVGCFVLWSTSRAQQWALENYRRQLNELRDAYAVSIPPETYEAVTRRLTQESADLRAQIGDLKQRSALAELQIANLTSKLAQAPNASAVVVWDEERQQGVLKVQGLPKPAENQDYQLWVIDPQHKKPTSGGVFPVQQTSQTKVTFAVEQPVRQVQTFAVSLERKGGAPEAQGPIVLLGQ